MSPRAGVPSFMSEIDVNGTRRSYASLFTKIRSPSWMVGSIDPDGTSYQSASDERALNTTSAMSPNVQTYSQTALTFPLKVEASSLTGAEALASSIDHSFCRIRTVPERG